MWRFTIALAAGCTFQGTAVPSDGAPGIGSDARIQPPDAVDGGHPPDASLGDVTCIGQGGLFVGCTTPQTSTLILTGAINTDTDSRCETTSQVGGPKVCMIVAQEIIVTTAVTATGKLPLVLLGTDSIIISGSGSIDVSTHRAAALGAGANDSSCGAPTAGMPDTTGGGGGAGGSFGHNGGNGGHGSNGNASGGAPASPQNNPTVVHGGCPGGVGADGAPATGGTQGNGGGALYLLAGSSIIMSGDLIANGGGAGGGGANGGGGGGAGTGGLIGLMAAAVTVPSTGTFYANGGGGGGGGNITQQAIPGVPGMDGLETLAIQAPGGIGAPNAGSGGGGGVNTTDGAPGQDANAAGGGGGGSVGVVYIKGQNIFQGQSSPPVSFH